MEKIGIKWGKGFIFCVKIVNIWKVMSLRIGYMNSIGSMLQLFDLKTKSSKLNKRSLILKDFQIQINNEREAMNWRYKVGNVWKKYIPITGKELGIKLAHIKDTEELLYFLSICKDYKKRKGSFQKCFFGSLKPKKT